MFITIINVDCLKCLKTQFALHGRCATSNVGQFIRSLIALYFWDRVDLLSGVGTVLSLFAEETR